MVDDEKTFIELVKLNLEGTGRFDVRTENGGADCLAAAIEFKPHLILLDIMMPDVEGSVVAARLKENPETGKIPIIFLTAVAKKEEVDSGSGLIGGHPFIAKPVTLEKLLEVIEKNLRGRSY